MSPRGITITAGAALLALAAALLWSWLENEPPPPKPAVAVAPVTPMEPAKADGPASAAAQITSFQPRLVEAPNPIAPPPPPPAEDPLSPTHLQRLRSMLERNMPPGNQAYQQLQEWRKNNPATADRSPFFMGLDSHLILRGYARHLADPIDGPVMLETLADPKFFRVMRAHLAKEADKLQLRTDVVTARTPEELVSLLSQAVNEAQPAFERRQVQDKVPPPMVSLEESWRYFGAAGEFLKMFADFHDLNLSPDKGFFPKPPDPNIRLVPVNR